MIKKIINIIGISILGVIVILLLSTNYINQGYSKTKELPFVMKISSLSVLTGSMEPAMMPGDMILIKETEPQVLKKGDIVTYKLTNGDLVTHRIIGITKDVNNRMFKFQGDANNTPDLSLITKEQIVGRYLFRVPQLASILEKLKGPIFPIGLGTILLLSVLVKFLIKQIDELKRNKEEAKG